MATLTGTYGGTITYTLTYSTNTTTTSHTLTIQSLTVKYTSSMSTYFFGNWRTKYDGVVQSTHNIGNKTSRQITVTPNKSIATTEVHSTLTKTLELQYQVQSGGSWNKVKSINISIPAKTSYAVSYNANGGTLPSIADSYKKKWYNETLKLYGTISRSNATTTYTYTFKGNGNGAADTTKTATKTTKYTFASWNTNSSGTGTTYAAGANYTTNAALNLYAKWTAGTPTTTSLTTPSASWTGYTFKRWNTSSTDGSGTTYNANASCTPTSNLTLYAIWNHSITYNANGGTGAPETQTALKSAAITITSSQPTYSGYTFKGWSTSNTGDSNTDYNAGKTLAANAKNITLYAVWKHIITFNYNGSGASNTTQDALKANAITISSTKPTRNGYTFKEWNTKSDGTGTTYAAGATYAANAANITLYAVWAPEITNLTASRTNSSGTIDILGGYVKVNFSVSNQTSYVISIDNSSVQTVTNSTSGSKTYTLNISANPETAYTIAVTATNSVGSVTSTYTLDKSAYTKPAISSILTERVKWDENANVFKEDDEGTFLKLSLKWSVYNVNEQTPSQTASISVSAKDSEGNSVTTGQPTLPQGVFSGNPSVFYLPLTGTSLGPFSTEKQYTITVTVSDKITSTTRGDTLSAAFFMMDVLGDAYYYQPTTDTSISNNKIYYTSIDSNAFGGDAYKNVLSLESGDGRNLLYQTPKTYTSANYEAYKLNLVEPLQENTTYTIQFWNIDVAHSAKTDAQLGIFVYYCGGSVNFGNWMGTNYFISGHADHLKLTFTPTSAQISHSNVTNAGEIKYIVLYNSTPNATGTRSMSIEKWKLEKGDKGTDWTIAPEDVTNPSTAGWCETSGLRPGRGIAFGMPAKKEGMHLGYSLTLGKGNNEEMAIKYFSSNREGDMLRFLPGSSQNKDDMVIGGDGLVTIKTNSLTFDNSGGEVAIKYQTPLATLNMIKFLPGTDVNGHGILIGGGGTVIIGAGESANNLKTALNISPGTKHTYITADSNIEFYPNCNTIGNRNKIVFASNGDTVICSRLYRKSNTVTDSTATVSSSQLITGMYEQDGNGQQVGYSEIYRTTSNDVYRSFAVTNKKSNLTSALYLHSTDGGIRYFTSNIPNRVLWSGALFMTSGHQPSFSGAVSDQLNGIVLCWSAYVDGSAKNYDWVYTFIPKHHTANHGTTGVGTVLATADFGAVGMKYVYVYNDHLVGNDKNDDTGTANGITYRNNYWALRYVLGV